MNMHMFMHMRMTMQDSRFELPILHEQSAARQTVEYGAVMRHDDHAHIKRVENLDKLFDVMGIE
jgi:hypothetical protein